jgi:hypothetical protein
MPRAPGMAYELVQAANSAGIPNERLYLDTIIFPWSRCGAAECACRAGGAEGPAGDVRTSRKDTCGLSNISSGLATDLRSGVNCVYMAMLAALGLSSAIVDVLDPNMRARSGWYEPSGTRVCSPRPMPNWLWSSRDGRLAHDGCRECGCRRGENEFDYGPVRSCFKEYRGSKGR